MVECAPVTFFAKSNVMFFVLTALTTTICLLNFILSIIQMEPINEGGINGWKDDCTSKNVGYLYTSPFKFEFKNSGDIQACGWPPANSIYRIIIGILSFIAPGSIYFSMNKEYVNTWFKFSGVKIISIILTGSFFGSFMIDCDHTRIGFEFCENTLKDVFNIKACWVDLWIYIIFCDLGCFIFLLLFYGVLRERGSYLKGKTKKDIKPKKKENTNDKKSGETKNKKVSPPEYENEKENSKNSSSNDVTRIGNLSIDNV